MTIDANGTLSVKCRGKFCGHGPGIVVIHQFDLANGKYTTRKFREPPSSLSTGGSQ